MNLMELLGLDLESQAKGEVGALNSRRTGFDSYDLGDRFRGLISGVSREALEKRTGEIADQQLTDLYQPQADINARNLQHLTADFQGVKGKTEGEIKAALGNDKARAAALQTVQTNNPDLDVATIDTNAQVGGIMGTGAKATKDATTAETRRQEGRADDLLMLQMLQNNRQSDRQFQLQQAQQNYQNRALDLKEARLDRKDRQAAIQAMMAGLSQLGASIAI